MTNHKINTFSLRECFGTSPKKSLDFYLLWKAVPKGFGIFKYIWPVLIIIIFYPSLTFALDVTIQWEAYDDINLAGYKIYYDTDTGIPPYNGSGAHEGNSPVSVSLAQDQNPAPGIVEYSLHNLPDADYYFAITAYTDEEPPVESDDLNVISTTFFNDETAPIISNLQVAATTDTTAVIQWTTDELSDSVVQYGIGGIYLYGQSDPSMVTTHSVTLTELDPDTTYDFRVFSTDASDNTSDISGMSFTTEFVSDVTPPIISNVHVASKTYDTAVIAWTTDEDSNSVVQYGKNTGSWGSYPLSQSNGSLVTSHSVTLSGLNSNTTYYFQTGSSDASDNGPTVSNEMSFTTDEPPPFMVQFPTIDYANNTIDLAFNKSNMQNATTEANYTFSPSLLFKSLGGSDDITFIGGNTYRLTMSSIPNDLIFTLTVNNILDESGNPVTPNFVLINDNDDDGMADDWEINFGIDSPSGDADGDGLDNFGEYDNGTNPNDSDTDGDGLPDGWEVTYDLDPNDNTGVNGGSGDPDGDSYTNYEEYTYGYNPNSDSSPKAKDPRIQKSIPRNNSGVTNKKRIPIDTSFAVRIQAPDGVDVMDATSIKFTINDGTNPTYERDLNNAAVVRVVKLKPDTDTRATDFWVVYDRSLDAFGNFSYDSDVNVKVDVRDKRGATIPQESYDFNIETTEEHDRALADRPELTVSTDAGMTTLTVVSDTDLNGFQIIYDTTEPITPLVEPLEEIPPVDLPYVTPIAQPVELGPPNVFNNPVTLRMPVTGDVDVRDMSVYLYDGSEWVYAASSYNTGGVIQPDGDGWVVPGSLTYDDSGITPVLEVQVYHFSGIQAGLFSGASSVGVDTGGGGGGCFIDTMSDGSLLGSPFYANKTYGYLSLFIVLALIVTLWASFRKAQDRWRRARYGEL